MTVDVVIPVYRGLQETRRCIESVLACTPRTQAEIVVVDDATPEPAIAQWLDALAAESKVTLLRNESNVGFVRSVNRGMSRHDDRDVVLLNSDTEVANDWLERLATAAHRHADIATVTPFSNNATICSYPFWGWTGGVPGTLGLAALDLLFAGTNTGLMVDVPTAVGFCMYIRRDALRRLGLFDAERYGRGYGEENDFCMRALKGGLRNVLAGDVFVYHEGGVSFSSESAELMKGAEAALLEAHPDYHERVQAFLAEDAAQPLRSAMDLARIRSGEEEARHVLLERQAERRRWADLARGVEQAAARREAELDAALARATEIVREHTAELEAATTGSHTEIQRLNEEIRKLREGLAYAESLAFGRQKELEDIRARRGWRLFEYMTRHSSGG